MAGDTDELAKDQCNYCKRPVLKKYIKCKKCSKVYHNSCSTRLSCCDDKLEDQMSGIEKKTSQENLEDANDIQLLMLQNDALKTENDQLNQENRKLKRYVLQLEEKLKSLHVNKNLGQEDDETQHRAYIKEIISQEVNIIFDVISQDMLSIKSRLNKLEYTNDKNTQRMKSKKETTKNSHIQTQIAEGNPVTPKQNNELEVRQRQIMNDIINLEPPSSRKNLSPPHDTKQNIMDSNFSSNLSRSQTSTWAQAAQDMKKDNPKVNGKWTTVQRKKSVKKMIGEGENNRKFGGANPKVWMYLYRIKPDVNKADILEYLREKTAEEESNIIVKELQNEMTYIDDSKYKCYMVGADFKFKNDFYNPQFWPKGVGYKRFDFKLHTKYIIPEQGEKSHHQRPDSFLVKS